jgi:serine/threonine protein kinase
MSRPVSTDAFVDLLRHSKLLENQRLTDYLKRSPALPKDPRKAAQCLVKDGLLTAFQAEQLLAGRYKGFFLLGGQYKLLRPIGRGGMCNVFLCEHVQLKRHVAVKVLPRDQARDKVSFERFQREARAAAALDHPNIVRVYDVSAAPSPALLVLEYAEGKDLQEVLAQGGAIPYPKAVGYVLQAAAALEHAHERGIIHRDIKPANLLLDRNGVVKILDMGLARFLDKDDRLTAKYDSVSVLGTADFISPEQALCSSQVDVRTDIYSLGVTLYTLICGRTPFGGSAAQKLLAHQARKAVPAHKVRPEVPAALSAVIARMMAKDLDRRYATASEVLAALARFADAPPPPGSGVRLPIQRPRSRRPLLIGGGVSLALVVVALGLALLFGRQSPSASAGQVAVTPPGQPGRPFAAAGASRLAERELYRLKLEAQRPFVGRIENREFYRSPPFPASWRGFCWKGESVAEVLAERVVGSMALGLRSLSGKPTCQLTTHLSGALHSLAKGRRYVLRLEYQGQNEANGWVAVRQRNYRDIAVRKLGPTDDRWEVLEIPFELAAEPAHDLAFGTTVSGPETTIFIRSVVLVERP